MNKSTFPTMTLPESVRGWQSTWFYCQDESTPGQSTGLPPFSMDRVDKPSSLKVLPEEKAEVKMLMERVVQLVRDGVTGMDLLEVFLRRRIQPLQFRSHCMWLYYGTEDETRVHPEAVDDVTLERWMAAVTGNKDNPRGARRIPPLDQFRSHCMWLYYGTEDETRVHPEAVDDVTLERWMAAVTGNKDNPRGARRIPPLDHNSDSNKVHLLCSPLCSCRIHFCLSCRLVD